MSAAPTAATGPPVVAGDLDTVAARLREAGVLDLRCDVPTGTGWANLPTVLDDVARWHERLAAQHADARAAAAYLSNWVAAAPALVVGLPAVVAGIVPAPPADRLALHRSAAGVVDAYAVASRTTVRRGPSGEAEGELVVAADVVAALTTPLVETLCDRLPVGVPMVWGGVADALASYVLWFGRETGTDTGRLWARTERLVDRLTAVTALRTRPRLMPVRWSGGTDDYATRGTCCLYYRTCGPDTPTELRYCSTCPLRDEDERTGRLVSHLEATAPRTTR